MLKINKKIEYALMALKFMDGKDTDSLTSAREICDQFKIPFDTTAKVLQLMNNKNILSSVKGIKGGYQLARPLKEITYLELSHLIEKNKDEHFCSGNKGLCELYETCNIATPLEDLNKKIEGFLKQLTLEELLKSTPSKDIK